VLRELEAPEPLEQTPGGGDDLRADPVARKQGYPAGRQDRLAEMFSRT
jgi:hypothetical protein